MTVFDQRDQRPTQVPDQVPDRVTVSFGEKYASSAAFDVIYRDGMALVEKTATYLDGDGRREVKGLPGAIGMLYATESMRLTTRLMQVASWLLIRRAVNDGELTAQDALAERRKVQLSVIGRPSHVKEFAELPPALRNLVEASYLLYDRIVKLDRMIEQTGAAQTPAGLSPFTAHVARLEAAFSSRGGAGTATG